MLVVNRDGTIAGVQDKVQLDPSEEPRLLAGDERRVFQAGPLTFGFAICHEGWRYPEAARWAARRGAQVVFIRISTKPSRAATGRTRSRDPANSFHEKAILCRAAENTCWFAAVNFAGDGSPTTSAVVRPDGTVHAISPTGSRGAAGRHRPRPGDGPARLALPRLSVTGHWRTRPRRERERGRPRVNHPPDRQTSGPYMRRAGP